MHHHALVAHSRGAAVIGEARRQPAILRLDQIEQEAIKFSKENWKSVKELIKSLGFRENIVINVNGKYLKHY